MDKTDTDSEHKSKPADFPIISIGASAGGLEAIQQFFRNTPPTSGLAFVLIQHLDPSHSSILTEILQRTTTMPVVEAQDQMQVAPNSVYVIPPNREMAIFHGKLQLHLPLTPRGQGMPIDIFMRALAEDQGELAVGIVLSGTGSDGTLGLRAILGAGGISLVQLPETAKFDGMPISAINAGYPTHVLAVEDMPQKLISALQHSITLSEHLPSMTLTGINQILMLLRSSCGHDFSQYKKTTIHRRIIRRMSLHNIEDTAIYLRFLKENPPEIHLLFKELLINVTNFFRDKEVFAELTQNILPQLLADKPEDYVFRVWVAGCATGEEAYSIAILLREWMMATQREITVQLYATDLDDDAIAIARAGLYLPNIVQDVTPERLRQFFVHEHAGYRITQEIREMVVFTVQNVIKDPPFTKLDLLSCRNVMIYLEPALQNRLIPSFHYALKAGGVLLLSPSESIGNHNELFTPISRQCKLYRATHSGVSAHKMLVNGLPWSLPAGVKTAVVTPNKSREATLAELAQRALLKFFAPAAVVTDMQGNILYVHGETGKYLRPAPGQATLNIIEMAREGLQTELLSAIFAAASEGAAVINRQLSIQNDSGLFAVNLNLRKLAGIDAEENLLLVSFQDAGHLTTSESMRARNVSESAAQLRIDKLEQELAHSKESLLATIEEQQASNEEMLFNFEEMQPANEALETSKVALQSVNEELITVIAELQAKNKQLSNMQSDMKNLLDNVSVGIIFHIALHIRRFTRDATGVYRLATTDINRHLGDIKSNLGSDDLLPQAQQVLNTLTPYEREVRDTSGSCYLLRIEPYRSRDNVIDGVVLTFTDITTRAEAIAIQEALTLAEGLVRMLREPLVVLNNTLHVVCASHWFYHVFKAVPDQVIQRPIYELANRQWDIRALRTWLQQVISIGEIFDNYPVDYHFAMTGLRKMLNTRRIVSTSGTSQLISLAIEEAK